MYLVRSIVAWLDRVGAWPAVVAIAVVAASYITGIIGLVWSFPLWLQLAIFACTVVLIIRGLGQVLVWVFLRSPRGIQNQMHALWRQGAAFVRAGTASGPEWEDWRDRVIALYAQRADAGDRAWLDTKLAEHDTAAAMRGLRALGRRLNKERRADE